MGQKTYFFVTCSGKRSPCTNVLSTNFEDLFCHDDVEAIKKDKLSKEEDWEIIDSFDARTVPLTDDTIKVYWFLTNKGIKLSTSVALNYVLLNNSICNLALPAAISKKMCLEGKIKGHTKVMDIKGVEHNAYCSAIINLDSSRLKSIRSTFYDCQMKSSTSPPYISIDFDKCNLKSFRICQKNLCKHFGKTDRIIKVELPLEMFLIDSECVIEMWSSDQLYRKESMFIGKHDICDFVDCRFCLLKLRNPKCHDWIDLLVIWGFVITLIAGLLLVIYLLHKSPVFEQVVAQSVGLSHKAMILQSNRIRKAERKIRKVIQKDNNEEVELMSITSGNTSHDTSVQTELSYVYEHTGEASTSSQTNETSQQTEKS